MSIARQTSGRSRTKSRGSVRMFAKKRSTASAFAESPRPTYFSASRREIGQMSLAHHACELVLRGATTVREVMRSIGRVHEIER